MAEILPLAAVLFAFGPQVGVDGTLAVGLQDDAEDLLAGPQGHRLPDTQAARWVSGTEGLLPLARWVSGRSVTGLAGTEGLFFPFSQQAQRTGKCLVEG